MSVVERDALTVLEQQQNQELTRQGRSQSDSAFPSFTIPGPLPPDALAVRYKYPPAEAPTFIADTVEAIAGWSRQALAAAASTEIPDDVDPSPSDIEWPY
eukprot:20988-Pyramimonas_sp.AAC.1